MSSVGDTDPAGISPGMVTIKNGVPSRNGERRREVVDGPTGWSPKVCCQVCEWTGRHSTLRCELQAKALPSVIGSSEEQFLLTVRIALDKGAWFTGYREMHSMRWCALTLSGCTHNKYNREMLPDGTATVSGVEWRFGSSNLPRICISLVRGNRTARWLAMVGGFEYRQILIAEHSCLKCILECTCQLNGKWLVICGITSNQNLLLSDVIMIA